MCYGYKPPVEVRAREGQQQNAINAFLLIPLSPQLLGAILKFTALSKIVIDAFRHNLVQVNLLDLDYSYEFRLYGVYGYPRFLGNRPSVSGEGSSWR